MKSSLLKITPSIANDRLVLSHSWVTNGHWAIKKHLVLNGAKLNAEYVSTFFDDCFATDMTDEQILKALPCDPDLTEKYEMSPMQLTGNTYLMRVFFSLSGKYTFINEQHRKLMNLEILYKSKTLKHLFFNDDCTKALMELRTHSIIEDPRYSRVKDVLDLLQK